MRDGWQHLQLEEVCELVNGRGFKPHEWKREGLPIIRIQNLNGSDNFNYYSGGYDKKIEISPGQLLFAWSGSRGASFGPHIWNGPKGVLNYHTWKVKPKNGSDRDFLFQLLGFETQKIEASSHGASALVHVQKRDMEKRIFAIPPLPEQRKIAAILRTWDLELEKLSALRKAKEARLDALRASLLFGTMRMGASRPNWPMRRLGEVTGELTQRNAKLAFGRAAVMGVSNARGIVPMREQTVAGDISRYLLLPPLGFAYNPMRINVGSIAMNKAGETFLVSPDYIVFACRPDSMEPDYLDHLRQTRWWLHHINAGGSGSVRQRTYYDDLAALQLRLPEIEEQRAIVAVLNAAKADIDLTDREIAALTRQKRGLMQKLLTGEWQVVP